MGNRLTQIATRTGDEGTTGLGNNQRVSKNSLRVHAMGEVDELNSHIGVLLCEDMPEALRSLLIEVQHQLFNLGGELSIPGFELLKAEAVLALDAALAEHNAALPKLQEFILPAGSRAASLAHVCRTVARRAERAVVALGAEEALNDTPRQYLNRLSDLMFVLARVLNRMNGGDDVYWKSQRMVGHLSKIDAEGIMIDMIVDEDYHITEKPLYDTSVMKKKCRETLIAGEHIDWIWINEVWGGIKIGPNRPSFYGNVDANGFQPLYLNVEPLRFQFKGDFTLYGCKLPVEGSVFSDRNTKSSSLVDKMKPYQIGYNLVNNQIADILVDELGTVIMLDQNALPKHSMGEDWGHDQFGKAYVAMKNFQMLPLDTSITNTENALNFQHYQVLNLEQTNRLMSRIQLSNYFKGQAFESIGINPQRMGQVIAQETATGVQQAMNASYSQTEMYFIQHSEYLMPRVHQMRTDLAQYYHSTRPSLRMQYMTSMDEKVNFEINGTELLARDLNVFTSTKVNQRMLMEQIRQLAMSNNTSGASIYDLGNILKADSLAEITHTMKGIEEKNNKAKQQEMQAMQQTEQMKQEAETQRQEAMLKAQAEERALDREKDVRVAEIRSAGFTAMKDMNNDGQSDYISTLEYLDKKNAQQASQQIERDREINRQATEQQKLDLKRQELASRERIAEKQVQVARTNKNKYDEE